MTRSARGPGEQFGDERRRAEDLLEVVQDQEQLTLAEVLLDARSRVPVRSLPDSEGGAAIAAATVVPVVSVLQRHEDDAVGEPAGQSLRRREGDPRLAGATRSRPASGAPASHEVGDPGHLHLTTDERCRRHGDA